jgi:tRNA (guanine37-N1)-methyltransferase
VSNPTSRQSGCLSVPKNSGNKAKTMAAQLGIADKQLEIVKVGDRLNIPILRQPAAKEMLQLQALFPELNLTTCSFPIKQKVNMMLEDVLGGELPSTLMQLVPHALDVVGDIAIVEIAAELEKYKEIIGESMLTIHPNIKSVLIKTGAVTGVYRLRQVESIAGEQRTATVHKEYGCSFNVDVAKAYFSPRLSTEHKRVASLIQANETVLDLFAGVGPFAILIAKNNLDAKVYAIDLNPYAIELLKKNIRLNRVEDRVTPIVGDARQIVEQELSKTANRVIMNLPERAMEFIDVACNAVKPSGGIIHFYGFLRHPESIENVKRRFANAVKESGRELIEFSAAKTIRETAPFEWQFVLDGKIL